MILIIMFVVISFVSLHRQLLRKKSDLKLSEEKFRLIFEHSPLGIIHFDEEGFITACNPSFEKIMGISKDKILGIGLKTLSDARITETIKSVLTGSAGFFEDTYRSDFTEKSAPIRAYFAPLQKKNGCITGGIGIIEDITDWRLNEEKLVQARESAEKANRTKSIFLANMSHEVRTPLNGILGLLQVLNNTMTDPGHREYVNMAISSGKRLTRLLSDILDLAKIESEQFNLIKEEINVREMLDSVKEALKDDCARKTITLSYSVSDNVPDFVQGDELRIRQIIQNLAENSVKFTSEGSITIEADFIVSGKDKGILTLKVKDTGIGIDKDKLTEIMEPFRQVENTYTRKFQGAGLGLAIVKRLLGLMDGDINIESTTGRGTEVKCTMKVELCEESLEKETEEKLHEESAVQPLKILLVEDDRINSLMVRRLLEKMSHTVTDAANGIEALQCFAEADFDLVLMDIQMPEMNFIEAISEIRKTERFGSKSGVCAIALTAYAMAGDREKFLAEGFDEYLPKPVDMQELNYAVLRLNPLKTN
jgi:two-component system sensor histidine kinase EvgS